MAEAYLNITLVGHHDYCRDAPESFFNTLTASYLPLLDMFGRLEADKVPFACGIVFSPVLCDLLSDPLIRTGYADWLLKNIKLGEAEVANRSLTAEQHALAELRLGEIENARDRFCGLYQCDLIAAFLPFIDRGRVEAIAGAATWAFLPHYADLPEVVNAQIEVGIQSHKQFFSYPPTGFYLPHMGYAPGLEIPLREYGVDYTILNTAGFLFANPTPAMGIFAPAHTANGLTVFGCDHRTIPEILGPSGFIHKGVYCNSKRDAVYERPASDVVDFIEKDGGRLQSVYKYWGNNGGTYNPSSAKAQVCRDAEDFLTRKTALLRSAASYLQGGSKAWCIEPSLMEVMDLSILGTKWREGIHWLEALFRAAACNKELAFERSEVLVKHAYTGAESILPYPSATTASGYGENFLDSSNTYILRYARKVAARMTDLANRYPSELALRGRMLTIASRAVLLSQASDWPRIIHKGHRSSYAAAQFADYIRIFDTIFTAIGSKTADTAWIAGHENALSIFPWINYRIFSGKRNTSGDHDIDRDISDSSTRVSTTRLETFFDDKGNRIPVEIEEDWAEFTDTDEDGDFFTSKTAWTA